MASARKYEHTDPLFTHFKLLTLLQIYIYNCAQFMFKMFHSMLPVCIDEMFSLFRDVHTYGTRHCNYCLGDKWELDSMRRSIRIQGVIIWNKVVELTDIICSPAVFKHKIKYLINTKQLKYKLKPVKY